MAKGRFITFEGTEGSGKSTLISYVARELEARGLKVVLTREPGGTGLAEKIRQVVLENAMSPWTELFLYEAARADHVAEKILPSLRQGAWVLCDRFSDSTLAYQGEARGLPWNDIELLNRVATQGRKPDLTFWLDVPPEMGLARAREITRFEAEGAAFQSKVRKGYVKLSRREPKRFLRVLVDGQTPEQLAKRVMERIQKWLPKKAGTTA